MRKLHLSDSEIINRHFSVNLILIFDTNGGHLQPKEKRKSGREGMIQRAKFRRLTPNYVNTRSRYGIDGRIIESIQFDSNKKRWFIIAGGGSYSLNSKWCKHEK